jgi:hypothetical protein
MKLGRKASCDFDRSLKSENRMFSVDDLMMLISAD